MCTGNFARAFRSLCRALCSSGITSLLMHFPALLFTIIRTFFFRLESVCFLRLLLPTDTRSCPFGPFLLPLRWALVLIAAALSPPATASIQPLPAVTSRVTPLVIRVSVSFDPCVLRLVALHLVVDDRLLVFQFWLVGVAVNPVNQFLELGAPPGQASCPRNILWVIKGYVAIRLISVFAKA